MVKKGLSFEEKQQILLQALLKKNNFFNLKEIEKIGGDAGIVVQSVKEVLQALVDDNLVKTDKVGNQNVYWALSTDTFVENERKHEAALRQKKALEEKAACLRNIVNFRSQPEYGTVEKRSEIINNIEKIETQIQETEREIHFKQVYSVQFVRMLKNQLLMSFEGSVRWADNICISRSWLRQRFPSICEADINQHFDIPPELA